MKIVNKFCINNHDHKREKTRKRRQKMHGTFIMHNNQTFLARFNDVTNKGIIKIFKPKT
jgi:hypothetical protein